MNCEPNSVRSAKDLKSTQDRFMKVKFWDRTVFGAGRSRNRSIQA